MLARLRLKRSQDFRAVYGSRRARHGRLMVIHSRPNDLGHPRVGFSISTRVGGAVQRNQVKRRLRQLAQSRLAGTELGIDLVVVVRQGAAGAEFAELESEFGALVAQVLGL
ncbi:MAG: ribonuclease P protein component [Candidatus Dormibacteria bacterium]